MGRPLNWKKLTVIINTIRKNPSEWKDLHKLGIPEKTLQRYIREYLGEKGVNLVKKKGRFWVWCGYEYPKKHSPEEHDIAIKHAKDLLPGLQPLLETDPGPLLSFRLQPYPQSLKKLKRPYMHFEPTVVAIDVPTKDDIIKLKLKLEKYNLSVYIEEHLRTGYPEIYQNLINFRRLFPKVQEMRQRLKVCTKNMKGEIRRVINRKEKELILRLVERPPLLGEEVTPLFLNKEDEDFFNVFFQTRKSMLENYQKLAAGLHLIRMSVEHGWNPLEGRCKICPNVIIKKEKRGLPTDVLELDLT